MLTATLTILALIVSCIIVWFAARRSKAFQRVSSHLSGPVEQMQEQILLTADSAVDRLDGKIAQMEILLSEIDRRSTMLAQQSKQQQMQQLQLEQQQQQLIVWLQTQRQQLEKEFEMRQQVLAKLQVHPVAEVHVMPPSQRVAVEAPMAPKAVTAPETRPEIVAPPETSRVKTTKSVAKPVIMQPPPQDKRTVILDMAENGFSVTDIAQKMGIGKGEVMLLLKLRKRAVP